MIIIDSREPADLNLLKKMPRDERCETHLLPAGDILITTLNVPIPTTVADTYAWSAKYNLTLPDAATVVENPDQAALIALSKHAVLIERKTPSDFLNSIKDGRLFDQAMRVSDYAQYPVILITGFFYESGDKVEADGRETGWNWWSVQMAIFRLLMAGCAVLQCRERQLADVIAHLWKWQFDSNKFGRKAPPAPLIPLSSEASFLCGLPGIGPEKANALIKYSGTPSSALQFLTNPNSAELSGRPEGFGRQTIMNARRFLGLTDQDVLLPVADKFLPPWYDDESSEVD